MNSMPRLPDRYTMVEGGRLRPWTAGKVTDKDLEKRARPSGSNAVNINGVAVHSLWFGERRWDCLNGWNDYPVVQSEVVNAVES